MNKTLPKMKIIPDEQGFAEDLLGTAIAFDTGFAYLEARNALGLTGTRISLGNAGKYSGEYTLTPAGLLYQYVATEKGGIFVQQVDHDRAIPIIEWANS